MGLNPSWLTPSGPFVITTAAGEQYVHASRSSLNSHVGISLAKDKYLTRLILERHGLPNIAFAQPVNMQEAEAFLRTYTKIVAKPVRGYGAHDIRIITDASQFVGMTIPGYIFEEYIAGKEVRYLILNGATICVHESDYGTSVEQTRALERISYPEASWDPSLIAMSAQIASILSLNFAAIDYLIDDQGTARILEVNTTPGLKWFHAPSSGPPVDVAFYLLEAMLAETNVH